MKSSIKSLMSAPCSVLVGMLLATGAYAGDSSLKNPSGQVYASPSQVRMVQERLREQGREPGVDGMWDERTIAEVRDFQRANGLAPTGEFDTSLLSELKIGEVLAGETSEVFLDGLLQADRSDAAEAKGRGAPIYVSPVHVAQIQHVLGEEGYYEGAIDGAWGPETAQAANRFRQERGLEASEGLDIALLLALNRHSSAVPQLASAATLERDGVPLHAGPSAIRALQRELAAEGHETGDIDGMWGENTRQALRSFQQDEGLEPTGTLTLPTLAALGIDVAESGGEFAGRSRPEGSSESEQEPDAVAADESRD